MDITDRVNDVQRIIVKHVANQGSMNVQIVFQALFYLKINAKSVIRHALNVQAPKITNVQNVLMGSLIKYKMKPNIIAFHATQIVLHAKTVKNALNAKKDTLRMEMANVSNATHHAKTVMVKLAATVHNVKKDFSYLERNAQNVIRNVRLVKVQKTIARNAEKVNILTIQIHVQIVLKTARHATVPQIARHALMVSY